MEELDKAEEAYSEGLRLDPNNQDAKAALDKLQQSQRMWILVIFICTCISVVKLLQLREQFGGLYAESLSQSIIGLSI